MRHFIQFFEARDIILSSVFPVEVQRKPYLEALNDTLAEEIKSSVTIPPFDNSGMDGFAVRTEDFTHLPVEMTVIEEIPAGSFPEKEISAGTCASIMTGAPIPVGADAVVPVEWTENVDERTVRIVQIPGRGENIRKRGDDIREGDGVFIPGTVITPPVIGMLASLGRTDVLVAAPPRVAVIATGDELVEASRNPGPGQIRNSNGPALMAQVKNSGGDPFLSLIAQDTRESISDAVERSLSADVILLSGGVSVGEHDHVKEVLNDKGIEMLFWRVRQRPGKPLAYGLLQGKPVFGLPGNPVSSGICFEEYVRPVLYKMLGRTKVLPELVWARLAEATPKKKGLYHFTRGRAWYDEHIGVLVRDTGPQGSSLYSSMVQANCIIHLPEDMENPGPGTRVQIEWTRW